MRIIHTKHLFLLVYGLMRLIPVEMTFPKYLRGITLKAYEIK